jgi:Fic family protein
MAYIHQRAGWPEFYWDASVISVPLASVRHRQGRILGRMQAMGFELRGEAGLAVLTDDVVKTSAIEGETLDPVHVRSSIARRLGLDQGGLVTPGRDVEGIVEILVDATRKYHEPLTNERIFAWHAALFPTARSGMQRIAVGQWRPAEAGPMQVVSGPFGREKVHFEAPPADRLNTEMDRFIHWFNQSAANDASLDPVIRAALAHFWFVTIHPLEDGNGRIARAIAEMALAHADQSADRFYSMSSQIEAERRDYYLALERQQRSDLDVTPWLQWFIGCLDRAIIRADSILSAVLFKSRFWDVANRSPVNRRQQAVINRLLDGFEGKLTTSKYAKLAKCSSDTALRDIQQLLQRGILFLNQGGGRSTSYRLATSDELGE